MKFSVYLKILNFWLSVKLLATSFYYEVLAWNLSLECLSAECKTIVCGGGKIAPKIAPLALIVYFATTHLTTSSTPLLFHVYMNNSMYRKCLPYFIYLAFTFNLTPPIWLYNAYTHTHFYLQSAPLFNTSFHSDQHNSTYPIPTCHTPITSHHSQLEMRNPKIC